MMTKRNHHKLFKIILVETTLFLPHVYPNQHFINQKCQRRYFWCNVDSLDFLLIVLKVYDIFETDHIV